MCCQCSHAPRFGLQAALLPRRDLTNEFRQNVHAWMECFFEQWLKGTAGLRLQELAAVLQQHQTFPQLYIYSESDHVVPHTSVEAFMEVRHMPTVCVAYFLAFSMGCWCHWVSCTELKANLARLSHCSAANLHHKQYICMNVSVCMMASLMFTVTLVIVGPEQAWQGCVGNALPDFATC